MHIPRLPTCPPPPPSQSTPPTFLLSVAFKLCRLRLPPTFYCQLPLLPPPPHSSSPIQVIKTTCLVPISVGAFNCAKFRQNFSAPLIRVGALNCAKLRGLNYLYLKVIRWTENKFAFLMRAALTRILHVNVCLKNLELQHFRFKRRPGNHFCKGVVQQLLGSSII